MVTFSTLPPELRSTIALQLSPRDLGVLAQTSQNLRETAAEVQRRDHTREILSLDPNGYLGRIAAQYPLVEGKEHEWIRKIHETAAPHINAHRSAIQPHDWSALRIDPTTPLSGLSYTQLDRIGAIVQDRLLLRNVEKIVDNPAMIFRGDGSLEVVAGAYRSWLAGQARSVDNDRFNYLSYRGLDDGNIEFLQILLSQERVRDIVQCMYYAVKKRSRQVAEMILNSRHTISNLWIHLSEAIDASCLPIVEAILNSGRPISHLYHCLDQAIKKESLPMVEAILNSKWPISFLGYSLGDAIKKGSLPIVEAILKSGRPISEWNYCLHKAIEKGSLPIIAAILNLGKLNPFMVYGEALFKAAPEGRLEVCKTLFLASPFYVKPFYVTVFLIALISVFIQNVYHGCTTILASLWAFLTLTRHPKR